MKVPCALQGGLYLIQVPRDGVDVRWVAVATDEQKPVPIVEVGTTVVARCVHGGQHDNVDVGNQRTDHVAFCIRYHADHVCTGDVVELAPAELELLVDHATLLRPAVEHGDS